MCVCVCGGGGTHFRSCKVQVKSTAVVCKRAFKQESHVKPLSCKSKCNKFVGFKPSEVYVACNDSS